MNPDDARLRIGLYHCSFGLLEPPGIQTRDFLQAKRAAIQATRGVLSGPDQSPIMNEKSAARARSTDILDYRRRWMPDPRPQGGWRAEEIKEVGGSNAFRPTRRKHPVLNVSFYDRGVIPLVIVNQGRVPSPSIRPTNTMIKFQFSQRSRFRLHVPLAVELEHIRIREMSLHIESTSHRS